MKRIHKIIIAPLSFLTITSLFSCSPSTNKEVTIKFFDGSNNVLTLTGISGTKIEQDSAIDKQIDAAEIKADHAFKGWFASQDFSTERIYFNYFPNESIDVYGKYAKYVHINLDAGEGSFESGAVTTYYGLPSDVIPHSAFPIPTKANHSFASWQNNGIDFDFKNGFPSSDITLTASYKIYPTLTVNIDGKVVKSGLFAPESNIPSSFLEDVSLDKGEDYKFEGWYIEDTFKTRFNFESMPKTSTTIYANFVKKHSVSFVTNVEGYNIDPYYEFEGTPIKAPNKNDGTLDYTKFKIDNKYFAGWYTKENPTYGVDKQYEFTTIPKEDIILYALWVNDPIITVKIKKDGVDYNTSTINNIAPNGIIDLNPYYLNDETLRLTKVIYLDASSNEIPIYNNKYTVTEENITINIEYVSLNKLNITYYDPFGSALGLSQDSTYASEGSYSISKAEVDEITSAKIGADKKVINYTDSEDKNITFPYSINEAKTIKAIVGSAASVNVKEDVSSTSVITLNGFTGERINQEPVSISENNKFVIFGKETDIVKNDEHYFPSFYYIDSSSNKITLTSINGFYKYGSDILGTDISEIHVEFKPRG